MGRLVARLASNRQRASVAALPSGANDPNRDRFVSSLSAAIARSDRESVDDVGTLLVRQIAVLQMLGRMLSVDYREVYESEKAAGWLKLNLYTEGLYQQIHAAVTTAAVLVGERASPRLEAGGLSDLAKMATAKRHRLEAGISAEKTRDRSPTVVPSGP
jgi:hypothetical protein